MIMIIIVISIAIYNHFKHHHHHNNYQSSEYAILNIYLILNLDIKKLYRTEVKPPGHKKGMEEVKNR